jgi:hypothetical protein
LVKITAINEPLVIWWQDVESRVCSTVL